MEPALRAFDLAPHLVAVQPGQTIVLHQQEAHAFAKCRGVTDSILCATDQAGLVKECTWFKQEFQVIVPLETQCLSHLSHFHQLSLGANTVLVVPTSSKWSERLVSTALAAPLLSCGKTWVFAELGLACLHYLCQTGEKDPFVLTMAMTMRNLINYVLEDVKLLLSSSVTSHIFITSLALISTYLTDANTQCASCNHTGFCFLFTVRLPGSPKYCRLCVRKWKQEPYILAMQCMLHWDKLK